MAFKTKPNKNKLATKKQHSLTLKVNIHLFNMEFNMHETLGKIGFIIASGIYLLFVALFFLTHTKSSKRYLLSATMLTSFLSTLATFFYISYGESFYYVLLFETVRNIFWALILIDLLQQAAFANLNIADKRNLIFVTFISLECFIYYFIDEHTIGLTFHLIHSIFILLLLEQLYRRTPSIHKSKINTFCIAIALIYIYDFVFFADALLTHSVDHNMLMFKGWILCIAAPFMLLSFRRIEFWSVRVYISRDVVINGTLLIAAGLYLLFMSSMGYLIVFLDYSWNTLIQYLFIILSVVLFSSLFLFDSLRTKLKIFIVKHFYENKYDYREEWIRFSESLENKTDSAFQIALLSMLKPLNANQGILFEFNGHHLLVKAKHNIEDIAHVNTLLRLAKKAINHKMIIDLEELQVHNKEKPFSIDITSIANIEQIQYIIPITEPGEVCFVCMVAKGANTPRLDFEDKDLLWALSKHLSIFLNLHKTNNYIIENQQFIAFNQMSTFLVHDLKNILAQLTLISKNSTKHKNNPDFIEDTFITVQSASQRLEKVLSHLLKHKSQEYHNEVVNICQLVLKAASERKAFKPQIIVEKSFHTPSLVMADREKLTNILLNLIKNAQDACASDGRVKIYRLEQKNYFGICIEDNGIGMSEDFIANRLFKPFDTTKGNAGLGVGAYDAKRFVEQLNGYMNVCSKVNQGTRFEIFIPLHQTQAELNPKTLVAKVP